MRERIDDALDGDLPESQLTLGERDRLDRARRAMREVAGILRSTPAPDLTAGVMEALEPAVATEPRPGLLTAIDWLWRPTPVMWRPAYAFAATALLLLAPVAFGALGGGAEPLVVVEQSASSVTPSRVYVQFRFEALGASDVALAGSFTEWAPDIRLSETMPGVWSALVPLDPGVHDYTFVIDGDEWVADPAAPQVDDGFGGTNSRLFLTTPLENA
ncbi:MAG TPA: glycogen-binding domain-containing protein [Longimicrobiaceae bacterium]|nr:glycogen-binding domain-containing protein [Longimicrobiaceae bacterium]